jgi:hypothetical protein
MGATPILKSNGFLEDYCALFDNVFCCGDRAYPAFYPGLESILVAHQLVLIESWGSVNFYSLISGCDLAVIRDSHPSYTERGMQTAWSSELRDIGLRAERLLDKLRGAGSRRCAVRQDKVSEKISTRFYNCERTL